MLYLGIDPGVSGAIAFFDPKTNFLEVHDMPTASEQVNGKKRRRVDAVDLKTMIEDIGEDKIALCTLEKVWPMHRDTPTTAFGLGAAYATARAILQITECPYQLVAPQTWQKEFGISGGGKVSKGKAREVALGLFPRHRDRLAPVTKDGRVDAALLAIYGARKFGGFS